MYVCLCRRVTDKKVAVAIRAGASDSDEVARHCGAGSRCRGCIPLIEEMLERHTDGASSYVHQQSADQ